MPNFRRVAADCMHKKTDTPCRTREESIRGSGTRISEKSGIDDCIAIAAKSPRRKTSDETLSSLIRVLNEYFHVHGPANNSPCDAYRTLYEVLIPVLSRSSEFSKLPRTEKAVTDWENQLAAHLVSNAQPENDSPVL